MFVIESVFISEQITEHKFGALLFQNKLQSTSLEPCYFRTNYRAQVWNLVRDEWKN